MRCGLVFGSLSYLNEIRSEFLPKKINPEKSEQRYLMKTLDIHDLIDQAAGIFNFDWKQTKSQARPTGQNKILRDMLMLLLWEQGAFKNEEIGNAMGISYSGVSKGVSAKKETNSKRQQIEKKVQIVLFTIQDVTPLTVWNNALYLHRLIQSRLHDGQFQSRIKKYMSCPPCPSAEGRSILNLLGVSAGCGALS